MSKKLTQGSKGFNEILNHTHPLPLMLDVGVDVKDLRSATLPPTEDGFVVAGD